MKNPKIKGPKWWSDGHSERDDSPVVPGKRIKPEDKIKQDMRIDCADVYHELVDMGSPEFTDKYHQDCLKIMICDRLGDRGWRKVGVEKVGDWRKEFAEEFRTHYKYILDPIVIEGSIKWYIKFMEKYLK